MSNGTSLRTAWFVSPGITIENGIKMKIETLKQFFAERPQLSAHGFAKESGISPRLLDYILNGDRTLTERTAAKLLPVMVKYGHVL